MRFGSLGLVVLVALVLPRSAAAQDASGTPGEAAPDESVAHLDAETARRARTEFEAGVEHFRAGRYREAIHAFQVAASLTPSADISYNIARAYEEVGRRDGSPADFDEAIAYYRRYLSDRVDPPDRAEVEGHIAELEEHAASARAALVTRPTTGTLVVRSVHDGARVLVDDREVGTTPLEDDIELEPGRHLLAAELEGYVPFEAEVTIEPGMRTGSAIELSPATTHRSIHGEPIFAWVAFGLAGASLIGSVVIGAVAASDQSAALTPFDPARLDAARGLGGWSDAALGAALGLATVGIVLFFAESAAVGTETSRGPEDPDLEAEADAAEAEISGAIADDVAEAEGGAPDAGDDTGSPSSPEAASGP